ncbi:LysR family transcriptional regulator [Paraferrimonas haliotis]|uniref:LysR family transcriptional regulator n=1 Tax=Paraferrimonas haliotis TaxID=2013866 RepID=A0AA37WZS8_9GAMM|nr:LysR family transcriptional regulator [Paraferrimonas haliotis]GLS84126.1 LysR family transcriptional regulator [Paraferrimonas haliotis]
MAKDRFTNLDLNLLRTFIVLHQEQNTRLASKRLFVSQPAISKALQRLRHHFEDELFVKSKTGLSATAFADELAKGLAPILNDLQQSLNHTTAFTPATLSGVIRIAMSPFLLSTLGSRIFIELHRQAPQVQFQLVNWSKSTVRDLINDEVQIGIHYQLGDAPKQLLQKTIGTERFALVIRKQHPYTKDSIDISHGIDYPLATIIASDWNSQMSMIEQQLSARGIETQVGFRSELPSAIMEVIANTNMMFPASQYIDISRNPELRKLQGTIDNQPFKVDVCSYFHLKHRNNPTVSWLEKTVTALLN